VAGQGEGNATSDPDRRFCFGKRGSGAIMHQEGQLRDSW
jgi:hypothetical protein